MGAAPRSSPVLRGGERGSSPQRMGCALRLQSPAATNPARHKGRALSSLGQAAGGRCAGGFGKGMRARRLAADRRKVRSPGRRGTGDRILRTGPFRRCGARPFRDASRRCGIVPGIVPPTGVPLGGLQDGTDTSQAPVHPRSLLSLRLTVRPRKPHAAWFDTWRHNSNVPQPFRPASGGLESGIRGAVSVAPTWQAQRWPTGDAADPLSRATGLLDPAAKPAGTRARNRAISFAQRLIRCGRCG